MNTPGNTSSFSFSFSSYSYSSSSRRQSWVALLMSLVLPGFGQLYNGELNRAIYLFLGFALLSVPGVVLVALYVPAGWMVPALVAGLVATATLWLYGIADDWRSARWQTHHAIHTVHGPQPGSLGGVYVLVFVLCNLLALLALIGFVRSHQVASYRVPSTSMELSVLQGALHKLRAREKMRHERAQHR